MPQKQELASSLQPVCMLLLKTVLYPTVLFVEAADDGLTSDFQHNYLDSSCYTAYCLNVLFTAVHHEHSSLGHTCTVGILHVWHTRRDWAQSQ